MKPVVIVCLTGKKYGRGHIMRSQTLAAALRQRRIPVRVFGYGADYPGLKRLRSFRDLPHPERRGAILVLDTKEIGERFIPELKKKYHKVIGFENTGRFKNRLDLLIDSNIYRRPVSPYTKYYGSRYVVVRPEIYKLRGRLASKKNGGCLLLPGGFGDRRWYARAVCGLARIGYTGTVYAAGRWTSAACARPCRVPGQVKPADYLRRLAAAELVITAGGISLFETLCIGKPLLALAKNKEQETNIRRLQRRFPELTMLSQPVARKIVYNEEYRKRFCRRARNLVDGRGLERIVKRIAQWAR